MATVTAMTAARMLAIEAESITGARVDAATFHLILTRHDGTEIDAGDIQGPVGPMNPNAADLSDVGPQEFLGQLTLHAGMKIPSGQNVYFDDSGGDRVTADGLNLYVVFNPTGNLFFHNGVDIVGHIDNAGNMSLNGNLFVNTSGSSLCIGGMAGGTNPCIYNDGSGNIMLQIAGAGHAVKTNNNILDDGAGGMKFGTPGHQGGLDTAVAGQVRFTTSNPADSMVIGGGAGIQFYCGFGEAVRLSGTGGLMPGNGAGAVGAQLWSGTGAPAVGLGNNGDFYFRDDTPGTVNQRLYTKSAGAWVGIV